MSSVQPRKCFGCRPHARREGTAGHRKRANRRTGRECPKRVLSGSRSNSAGSHAKRAGSPSSFKKEQVRSRNCCGASGDSEPAFLGGVFQGKLKSRYPSVPVAKFPGLSISSTLPNSSEGRNGFSKMFAPFLISLSNSGN